MKKSGGMATKVVAGCIYYPIVACGFIGLMLIIVPGLLLSTAIEWSEKILYRKDK
jgi:hypothetical protein